MTVDPWREAREALERLARRRTREGALDALSDIGSLRRLLDRAELDAVRDARVARRSWAEIATRLGITRQSAWERWRELDEEAPEPLRRAADEAARDLAARPVTVPDVVGTTWAAARLRLQEERLDIVSADPDLPPFLGPEAADFRVVDQKPPAGERVAAYTAVTVWLRRGPGSAGVTAPLRPPPDPRERRGAVDEATGESVP
ncbi:PASTA domain-containing protein [Pseudonocardia kujensis]|uniref:PASTA domain-containing protein n=1 Tax=Pseudonocardia kujensis TaxID=1128675 RepID=UPI001E401155|nr:PASTA domain-containing protein [Pseudonocardia kujensis]MCE0762245.1 PASTA domain-containing protein [Pseudonocardia kujensis]